MVRVIAGYIVNEEALVEFLRSVDYSPDASEGTPDTVDILFAWSSWYNDQPKEARLTRPNCFREDDKLFLTILTRSSRDYAVADVVLSETDFDREIRDKFLDGTGNKLDASDLQFVNKPQGVFLRTFGVRTAGATT